VEFGYIAGGSLRQVVRVGQTVRECCLRVLDDWAMFGAVMFAVACFLLVVTLC